MTATASALPWPQLMARLRASGLEVTKGPDAEGWYWAKCIKPEAHTNGDRDPSLRLNIKNGAAKCMAHKLDKN